MVTGAGTSSTLLSSARISLTLRQSDRMASTSGSLRSLRSAMQESTSNLVICRGPWGEAEVAAVDRPFTRRRPDEVLGGYFSQKRHTGVQRGTRTFSVHTQLAGFLAASMCSLERCLPQQDPLVSSVCWPTHGSRVQPRDC